MPARDATDLIRGDRENLYDVEEWLSSSQAGRALGTSGQWMTTLARAGKVRAVRTALGWLIDPDDLERYQEDRIAKAKTKADEMAKARTVKKSAGEGSITQQQARAAIRTVKEREGG